MSEHPIQPLELDSHGALRFKENRIVRRLLDAYPGGLNAIAASEHDNADYAQLLQLIGYSYSGIPRQTDEVLAAAIAVYEGAESELAARAGYLRTELREIRNLMRSGVSRLYEIHEDDLP